METEPVETPTSREEDTTGSKAASGAAEWRVNPDDESESPESAVESELEKPTILQGTALRAERRWQRQGSKESYLLC